MGDAVSFVKLGQGFCQSGEGIYFDFGEDSDESLSVKHPTNGERRAYSASNWFGRIRSASRSRFL